MARHRVAAAVLLVGLPLVLGRSGQIGGAAQVPAPGMWNIISDISQAPRGVVVDFLSDAGAKLEHRPPPKLLDQMLIHDFSQTLSTFQDLDMDCDVSVSKAPDTFSLKECSFPVLQNPTQWVAKIPNGLVEGFDGIVYDTHLNVYRPPGMFFTRHQDPPLPRETVPAETEKFQQLASVVQSFSYMYYHFLVETLSRIISVQRSSFYNPSTKFLLQLDKSTTEYEYLDMLGITSEKIVKYDKNKVYQAEELLFPTPVPRITGATKESLSRVRRALGVKTLPSNERNVIIYCSRDMEDERQVENEPLLLELLGYHIPENMELVVFRRGWSAQDTIKLFERAAVILGPHGAGLTNSLFSAPGTRLIEFLYLHNPPMMFWHMSSLLDLEYWMVPVPQGHWKERELSVPFEQVVAIFSQLMSNITGNPGIGRFNDGGCASGQEAHGDGCRPCPPGSYSAFPGDECRSCFKGQYSESSGSDSCRTCPYNTFSINATTCEACPESHGQTVLPGQDSPSSCVSVFQMKSLKSKVQTSYEEVWDCTTGDNPDFMAGINSCEDIALFPDLFCNYPEICEDVIPCDSLTDEAIQAFIDTPLNCPVACGLCTPPPPAPQPPAPVGSSPLPASVAPSPLPASVAPSPLPSSVAPSPLPASVPPASPPQAPSPAPSDLDLQVLTYTFPATPPGLFVSESGAYVADIANAASLDPSQVQITGLQMVDGGSVVTTELSFAPEEADGVMDFALAAISDPPGIFVSSEVLSGDSEASVVFEGITFPPFPPPSPGVSPPMGTTPPGPPVPQSPAPPSPPSPPSISPAPPSPPMGPPSSSVVVIFDDAFGPGWLDFSFYAQVSVNTWSYIQSGDASLVVYIVKPFGGLKFFNADGFTVQGKLEFWIIGGIVGLPEPDSQSKNDLELFIGPQDNPSQVVFIDDFVVSAAQNVGEWNFVSVPLTENVGTIENEITWFGGPNAISFYIDEIVLIGQP